MGSFIKNIAESIKKRIWLKKHGWEGLKAKDQASIDKANAIFEQMKEQLSLSQKSFSVM